MKEDGIERKGDHLSDQWDVGLDNEALEVDMRAILRAQEHLNKALHTHALPCLRQSYRNINSILTGCRMTSQPGHRFFNSQCPDTPHI